ncbi:MAG: response regulator [Chitinophagaceae bacterium]|nr:MAG: response regulator [Chitinophagaceae bacterium]
MCTILIIEDNEEIRENTAELLTLNKYTVLTAENGRTGFEEAKTKLPDLILCDMMMPDTDGQKFLELARTNEAVHKIPIIFFSAGTPSLYVQKKLIKASKGFLKKPFLEEDLLNTIEMTLSNQ